MGICWYCTWGWPKQVADIFDSAAEKLGENGHTALHYGQAHIVWEDENFEDDDIDWCLKRPYSEYADRITSEEFEIVCESLRALLSVPIDIRCCEPKDYDEENPRNFPPPTNIEMVPRR